MSVSAGCWHVRMFSSINIRLHVVCRVFGNPFCCGVDECYQYWSVQGERYISHGTTAGAVVVVPEGLLGLATEVLADFLIPGRAGVITPFRVQSVKALIVVLLHEINYTTNTIFFCVFRPVLRQASYIISKIWEKKKVSLFKG